VGPGPFDHVVIRLDEGAWLLQRPEPTRQPVEGNITVIAGTEGLLVVETGGTPKAGRDAVTLIQGLTGLPVRWVVNTHWHGDHHLGNPAFRLAWPQAEFIAHANAQRDMSGEAMDYLDGQDVAIQEDIDQLAGLLESGLNVQGEALDDATRARYLRLRRDLQEMLTAFAEIELGGVDRTFTDTLALDLGGRVVELIHPGLGNTDGDVVAWLPAERLLITGDLVVAPTPYGFGSYPAEWVQSLARLRALDPAMIVPGHGDLMTDTSYLENLGAMITDFRTQATIAVARGQDLETFRADLDAADWQAQFAGDSPLLQRLFVAWWVTPFSECAWREANGIPIVQGDDGN
jgi:glyoxylase-like metal-dependent hydrolase (beta-lactamase superfamily II)